jgi:hypothetical protein
MFLALDNFTRRDSNDCSISRETRTSCWRRIPLILFHQDVTFFTGIGISNEEVQGIVMRAFDPGLS